MSAREAAGPSHGVVARSDSREILQGNRKLIRVRGVDFAPLMSQAEAFETDGKTVMFVAVDGFGPRWGHPGCH